MKSSLIEKFSNLQWLENVRPYVFLRDSHQIKTPGLHSSLDWFEPHPIFKNALFLESLPFANQILHLEQSAFSAASMVMPRWVFYDCAVMPGFVAGFAWPRAKASSKLCAVMNPVGDEEFIPISLFIVIPTMNPGEWVAHNLCSINTLLDPQERLYGLGFLTKAFGLWYANIENLCGVTQWGSPAIRLHTHYGYFEILTAYTPVHSYPKTLTYRVKTDPLEWLRFFTGEPALDFMQRFIHSGFTVDPTSDRSLQDLQMMIEQGQGPFFLNPAEVRSQDLNKPLSVFIAKTRSGV